MHQIIVMFDNLLNCRNVQRSHNKHLSCQYVLRTFLSKSCLLQLNIINSNGQNRETMLWFCNKFLGLDTVSWKFVEPITHDYRWNYDIALVIGAVKAISIKCGWFWLYIVDCTYQQGLLAESCLEVKVSIYSVEHSITFPDRKWYHLFFFGRLQGDKEKTIAV